MIICSCNVLSDHDVKRYIEECRERCTVADIYRALARRQCCGRCVDNLRAIIDESAAKALAQEPALAATT